MARACPNINTKEWKDLVSKIGVRRAYQEFIGNNYVIPPADAFMEELTGVNASTKLIKALMSDRFRDLKTVDISTKDKKAQLTKTLEGSAVPRNQINLLFKYMSFTRKESLDKEDLILSLMALHPYTVTVTNRYVGQQEPFPLSEEVVKDKQETEEKAHYEWLTVPGGVNYKEMRLEVPFPVKKSHPDFATPNMIGWFRTDDKAEVEMDETGVYNVPGKEKVRRILEIQSDLFQKGREEYKLAEQPASLPHQEVIKEGLIYQIEGQRESQEVMDFRNDFLSMLNIKSNWVPFFVNSIIQDSYRRDYSKVMFPVGETAIRIEGLERVEQTRSGIDDRILELKQYKKILLEREYIPGSIPERLLEVGTSPGVENEHDFQGVEKPVRNYISEIGTLIKTESLHIQYNSPYSESVEFGTLTYENKNYSFGPNMSLFVANAKSLKAQRNVPKEAYTKLREEVIKANAERKRRRTQKKADIEKSIDLTIQYEKNRKEFLNRAGLSKISPIANFYESSIRKILEKIGPVQRIKDTYGNEWFELDLKNSSIYEKTSVVYYNLKEVEGKEHSKEIYDKLIPILDRMGISVTSIRHYEEMTGKSIEEDVNALVDPLRNIIAIADGKQGTVAEEIGHIIIENYADSYEVQRLLKYVERTQEYADNFDRYKEKYGDEIRAKKEILGRLLGQHLIKGVERKGDHALIRMLKRLWERFINLFRSERSKELREFLDNLTEGFIEGKLEQVRISEDIYYSLGPLQKEKRLLQDFIKSLENRIKSLEKRGLKGENVVKQINALKEEKDALQNGQGIIKFLEAIKSDSEEAVKYIDAVHRGKEKLSNRKLSQLGEFISYYEPYIQDLQDFLRWTDTALPKKTKKEINRAINHELSKFRLIRSFRNKVREDQTKDIMRDHLAEKMNLDRSSLTLDQEIKDRMEGFDPVESLSEVHKDSYEMEFWFGSMRDVREQTLRWIYSMLTDLHHRIFQKTLEFGKDLVEKAGQFAFRDNSWAFEVDAEGKKTGHLISALRIREHDKAFRKMRDKLHKKYGFSDDYQERKLQKEELKNKAKNPDTYGEEESRIARNILRDYNAELAQWFTENNRPIDNLNEVIEKRKKEFGGPTSEKYKEWRYMNIGTGYTGRFDAHGNPVTYNYYKGELSIPSDGRVVTNPYDQTKVKTNDWTNPAYDKLSPEQLKFLKMIKETKMQIDTMLPKAYGPDRAPQISESTMDIILGKKSEIFRRLGRHISESLVRKADDIEFGEETERRPDGSVIRYIPVRYTAMLRNNKNEIDADNISTDLISSMIAYHEMATAFREKTKELPKFELLQEQIGERVYINKRGKVKKGNQTVAYKHVEKFLDMYLSDIKTLNLEIPLLGGKKLNVSKVLRSLANYVRDNNLINNFFTMFSNYASALSFASIEDLIGQHTTIRSKNFARKEFMKHIAGVGKQLKEVNKTNKMVLLMEYLGLAGELRGMFDNLDKSKLTKRAINSGLYWGYQLGDFTVKSHVAIAALHNHRLVGGKFLTLKQYVDLFLPAKAAADATKEEKKEANEKRKKVREDKTKEFYKLTSAYDLISVDNYKLKIDITEKEWVKLVNKIKYVADTVDGRLGNLDYTAAHQHAVTALVTIHRGWLFSGFQRRFKARGINPMTVEIEEGYFAATGRVLKETIFDGTKLRALREYIAHWESLDPITKRAVMRTMLEIGFASGMLLVAKLINSLADDEDEWVTDAMAYASNRALLEMSSFINPGEYRHVMTDIFVPSRNIEMMLDVGDFFSDEEITRGQWKGWTKKERWLMKMIPGIKGFVLSRDPSAANQYLKNRPLKLIY